jgi:hypothetical protein
MIAEKSESSDMRSAKHTDCQLALKQELGSLTYESSIAVGGKGRRVQLVSL